MRMAVIEGRPIEPFIHPAYDHKVLHDGDDVLVLFTRRSSAWDYPDFVLVLGEPGKNFDRIYYGRDYSSSVSAILGPRPEGFESVGE
jgi:hypothetical protein